MTPEKVIDSMGFLFILIIYLLVLSQRGKCLDKSDWKYLQAALALTACADFCMLVIYKPLSGVLIFCLVQILYAVRYDKENKKAILIWVAVTVTGAALISYMLSLSVLYAAAVIYAICEGTAVYKAIEQYIKEKYPNPNRGMILAGMLLFALCDINVALYNVIPGSYTFVFAENEIPYMSFCGGLIWIFYIPSQILLALSGRRFYKHREAFDDSRY